jgi:sec-independent protein translocase protein TatA
MLNGIRLPELLIIAAIVLLLFGAKRLPDAARGLGRSLRIFKAETKGLVDDSQTPTAGDANAAPPVQPPAAPEGDRTQA